MGVSLVVAANDGSFSQMELIQLRRGSSTSLLLANSTSSASSCHQAYEMITARPIWRGVSYCTAHPGVSHGCSVAMAVAPEVGIHRNNSGNCVQTDTLWLP